jgi:DNA polymerase elongation subunit (family B)
MDTLVIDIETVPHRLEEYQTAFPKSKKKPGLHAIISEIVCVGLVDNGQSSIMDRQKFETEKEILQSLAKAIKTHKNSNIVTFNGKNFDFPVIQMRAALHNIKMDIPDKRALRNIDLYEATGGKWQSDISSCSLSELAWLAFGEGKGSNGSDVAKWWEEGNLAAIKAHCDEDIKLTWRLYQAFQGVLWP